MLAPEDTVSKRELLSELLSEFLLGPGAGGPNKNCPLVELLAGVLAGPGPSVGGAVGGAVLPGPPGSGHHEPCGYQGPNPLGPDT